MAFGTFNVLILLELNTQYIIVCSYLQCNMCSFKPHVPIASLSNPVTEPIKVPWRRVIDTDELDTSPLHIPEQIIYHEFFLIVSVRGF